MDERVPGMSSPISAEIPIVVAAPSIDEYETIDTVATFEAFYAEHRDPIARAVAIAIGDVDLAAESTDEAMIRAYQRWSKVGALDRPAGWVFRVAVNQSRSRFRRLARRAKYAAVMQRDSDDDRPFADSIGDRSLVVALQQLDPDQRDVVVLRILLEFSELECADALGIRPGTAKSRLHRGLAHLRAAVPHLDPSSD